MKNSIFGLIALLILQSCLTAPSNGRKDNSPKEPSRDPQDDNCATCLSPAAGVIKSQIYRNSGTEQLTLDAVQQALATNKLENTYRTVVIPTIDNVERVTKYYATDLKDCGEEEKYNGVKARLNHCFNVNGDKSTWLAKTNGISGESDWSLVTLNKEKGIMLWIDKSTNHIWSHILPAQSWTVASGVAAEEDENTYCEELKEDTFGQIAWRLPNRNEFLQADINGARFVLADTENYFWTASSDIGQSQAWSIEQTSGILKSVNKDMPLSVRCIGVILK